MEESTMDTEQNVKLYQPDEVKVKRQMQKLGSKRWTEVFNGKVSFLSVSIEGEEDTPDRYSLQ